MNKNFVSYSLAAKLKELQFNEECFAKYEYAIKSKKNKEDGYSGSFGWKKGECSFIKDFSINSILKEYDNEYWNNIAAPLRQQVLDWLREKHNITINITYWQELNKWEYNISNIILLEDNNLDYNSSFNNLYYSTYIETEEKAIIKSLEYIKKII